MFARFLLVGAVAAIASASPLMITFTGIGDGMLGTNSFTQADFTLTFNSDTTDVSHPSSIPVDWATPSGTPGMFMIMVPSGPTYTGVFTGDQSVFLHPNPEDDLGLWHYNGADWIAENSAAFATYDLMSSIGPVTSTNNGWPGVLSNGMGGNFGFATSDGNFVLSNITTMTATATVSAGGGGGNGGATATPEPSSALLFSIGGGALLFGSLRRKRAGIK